jgi:hypothetical protein
MRFAILVALSLALTACASPEQEAPADPVENAWVRLPAVEGRPAAAYFELHGGDQGDMLIAVDSERVATIELHETVEAEGRMTMRPINAAEVPPGETVAFAPGGRHAMLFGIDPEVTPGTRLALDFRFDSGRDVRVEAITVAAGDPPPFEAASGEADR